jgi:hypothetical protein
MGKLRAWGHGFYPFVPLGVMKGFLTKIKSDGLGKLEQALGTRYGVYPP